MVERPRGEHTGTDSAGELIATMGKAAAALQPKPESAALVFALGADDGEEAVVVGGPRGDFGTVDKPAWSREDADVVAGDAGDDMRVGPICLVGHLSRDWTCGLDDVEDVMSLAHWCVELLGRRHRSHHIFVTV